MNTLVCDPTNSAREALEAAWAARKQSREVVVTQGHTETGANADADAQDAQGLQVLLFEWILSQRAAPPWPATASFEVGEGRVETVSFEQVVRSAPERRRRFEQRFVVEIDEEMLDEPVEVVRARPRRPAWLEAEGT